MYADKEMRSQIMVQSSGQIIFFHQPQKEYLKGRAVPCIKRTSQVMSHLLCHPLTRILTVASPRVMRRPKSFWAAKKRFRSSLRLLAIFNFQMPQKSGVPFLTWCLLKKIWENSFEPRLWTTKKPLKKTSCQKLARQIREQCRIQRSKPCKLKILENVSLLNIYGSRHGWLIKNLAAYNPSQTLLVKHATGHWSTSIMP